MKDGLRVGGMSRTYRVSFKFTKDNKDIIDVLTIKGISFDMSMGSNYEKVKDLTASQVAIKYLIEKPEITILNWNEIN